MKRVPFDIFEIDEARRTMMDGYEVKRKNLLSNSAVYFRNNPT